MATIGASAVGPALPLLVVPTGLFFITTTHTSAIAVNASHEELVQSKAVQNSELYFRYIHVRKQLATPRPSSFIHPPPVSKQKRPKKPQEITRILSKPMVSPIPLVLALEPECRLLMSMCSFGPLQTWLLAAGVLQNRATRC